MNEFERLVHSSYRALLDIGPSVDDGEKFFTLMFEQLPETVVDKESLMQLQVDDLFAAMNHTRTATGAATLYRSLIQPLTSLDLILAKQESLRELDSNDRLRTAIIEFIEEVNNGEEALYHLLNDRIPSLNATSPYSYFRAAVKTGTKLADAAKQIPKPESVYLKAIVSPLQGFDSTESYALMRGPIHRTYNITYRIFRGLKIKEYIGFLTPNWKFRPSHFSIPALALLGGMVGMHTGMSRDDLSHLNNYSTYMALLLTWGGMCSLLYIPILKPFIDHQSVMQPLARQLSADPEFQIAIDSLGKLDEIISLHDYAKSMPSRMVLPRLEYADNHYFRAKNMKNPILAKANPNYVSEDVRLDGCKLTFVTGPNSGGKTTLAKTIEQIQMMGQMGSYVPADDVEMSVTDKISYQFYLPDRLQSGEGDFGVNLARTRDLFYAATPRSLVIFNTLVSGTTPHEGDEQSIGILADFATVGNNIVYVTHNYPVVEEFERRGIGQFLKTYFIGEKATYKFVPGISTESHAAQIAEKIGFSPADRRKHLIEKGYTQL